MSIGSIVVIGFILLLCRELSCWYWKINKNTDALQAILAELKIMNARVEKENDKNHTEAA